MLARALRLACAAGCLACLVAFRWPLRVERLIALLETSRELEVRVEAVRLLGRIAPEQAEQALRAAAENEEPSVRVAAVDALARARLAVEVLRERSSDTSPRVRVAAVEGLAALEDEAHCDLFARMLGDEVAEVGAAGARAVAAVCGETHRAWLKGAHETHQGRRLEGETHDETPAPELRPTWFSWLLKTGEPTLSAHEAERTLYALERSLPARATWAADPLAQWLTRAPEPLRARIVGLLIETEAAVALGDLLPLVRSGNQELRARLLQLLASQPRNPAVVNALWPLLRDERAGARDSVAAAIAHHADVAAVERLGRELPSQRGVAQNAFAAALARALPAHMSELRWWAKRRLRRVLKSTLSHSSAPTAALLMRALARLDERYATKTLISNGTVDRGLRVALLQAGTLDRGTDASAVRAKYAASRDAFERATALAAQLLADDVTVASLLAQLDDPRWPAAPIAAFGLLQRQERLSRVQLSVVCQALGRTTDAVTRHNLRLLMAQREPDCVDAERPTLERERVAPYEAAAALAFRGLLAKNGALLISVSDGAGEAVWPGFAPVGEMDVWQSLYRAIE